MKRWRGLTAWGIVLLVLGFIGLGTWGVLAQLSEPRTTVMLGSDTYRVTLARTEDEQKQGLSDTNGLDKGQGELFIFAQDGPQPMWMKDMRFDLDMVWLDSDKRVTHIEHGLTPDSYPDTYGSPKPARYVLEIPAGSASSGNIKVGSKATFELN